MFLIAPAVFAQNNRSAVASTGLDTNPCTVASPCRSFTAAIAHTNSQGEIIALDSAGYGPFSISFPITISGAPGVHAAITATSGQTGIMINAAATDKVTLRNLVLIGAGAQDGVVQATGGDLYIGGLLVRGFISHGIDSQNGNLTIEWQRRSRFRPRDNRKLGSRVGFLRSLDRPEDACGNRRNHDRRE